MVAVGLAVAGEVRAVEIDSALLAAWNRETTAAAARLSVRPRTTSVDDPHGKIMDVAGGTIHRWTGSIFIRGVDVDALIARLQHPGTPSAQEDVLESRLISRAPDHLRICIKLERRTLVTVAYDTEHDVTYQRITRDFATSRSVATRIEEVGGVDHGFLWRLNSYWQYVAVPGGVLVGRESMTRTIETLRANHGRRGT
jgi:hypothetical protein